VGSSFYADVKVWDASLKDVLGHHRGLQNKCGVGMFCTHHIGDGIFLTDALIEIISDNCVVIFSKTTCFYCKMSKKLFEDMNVNYTAVELDMNTNGSQFQDILEQMTGGRTVPRVFVNGTFVGGATDTQKLHEEGKLLPLVHQCQVKRKSSTAI
uniref:Glutaredoxin-2, mitochondrial n=1 Tax=Buteo japonicus TaxID=224669 RepID=A0A8C0BKP3_9AVES